VFYRRERAESKDQRVDTLQEEWHHQAWRLVWLYVVSVVLYGLAHSVCSRLC